MDLEVDERNAEAAAGTDGVDWKMVEWAEAWRKIEEAVVRMYLLYLDLEGSEGLHNTESLQEGELYEEHGT